jgi:hypothetical protein
MAADNALTDAAGFLDAPIVVDFSVLFFFFSKQEHESRIQSQSAER